jgi:hypothetical protein
MSDKESDIGANVRTAASRLSNLRQRSWLANVHSQGNDDEHLLAGSKSQRRVP